VSIFFRAARFLLAMKPHRRSVRREAQVHVRPHCVDPPADFFLCTVFQFLGLRAVQKLCLVSSEWRRVTIQLLHSMNALDLRFHSLTPSILVFLVGLTQRVTAVRKLSISGELWEEKQAGVLGLLLLKSPDLREIEFTGSLHYSILKEIVKYCQHLERLWKIDRSDLQATSPETRGEAPLDGPLLGALLNADALDAAPLEHSALQVLHIENIGCSAPPRGCRFARCAFPMLRALCVSEHPQSIRSRSFLPFQDILHIIDRSPHLERLEISAPFSFTRADCEHIVRCVPKLQCLQLKPYTTALLQHSEPRLCDAAVNVLLRGLASLQSLSIESVGWEEHWDNYRSLQEPFLVLQYPFPSLTLLAANVSRFHHLQACVLFGEVTNAFVHTLLTACPLLRRLELYFLGRSTDVDDALFSVVSVESPYLALEWLHLHLWKHPTHGPTPTLTAAVLTDLSKKFPRLHKLAVLGLRETDSAVCRAVAVDATHVKHLVIGPILSTTSELLNIVGCLPALQQLDLCWDGGSLPSSDEEFDTALGTHTLRSILRQINPAVRVRDVGGAGHFYPL